eukprot:Tamp_06269.p1 GENE.Tamp_06269~~Tamp_06269.p1  ORF type:complete len:722 (+),score=132.32 Tamp_06269:67-2166(+)
MAASELDNLILEMAMLMNSGEQDHGAEAARQLRVLSMDNRGDEQLRSQLGQSPLLLEGLLHLLGHGTDAARYWCCQCIVSLSHKHTQNQSTMAKYPGMMEAILEVLLHGSRLSRGAACSALVESTFRNAENALLVAKTPGLMHGVVSVMQNSVGDVRDDAAGVLRNCSNYSQEAAEVIVQTEGVLDALIEMCKGQHNSDRFTAMGTIQNLTRCESVAPLLCKTRVVADALIPALHSVGTGEEHDVMRAEALMAITNLATGEELKTLVALPDIAEVIVQMLRCAVRGQAWKDVAWYDAEECLRPLAQMTVNPDNHTVLRSAGLVHVLVDLLCFWIEEQAFTLPTALHAEARCVLARVDERAKAARRASCDVVHVHEGNPLPPLGDAAVAASRHCSERDHVVDSCIGIGHERLRHAVAVWEVAASRPAHAEAESDDSASTVAPGLLRCESHVSDRTTSWCTGERIQANHEVPREVDMTSMALVRMASTEACARTMRRLGLADVLRAVALAADSKEPAPNLQPWAQLSVIESRHLAGAFVPACERGECRVCMRVLLRWARRHAACEWVLRVRGLVTRASRCCACMLAFATKRHGSSPRRTMLRVMPRGMTARLPTCICSEHGPACTPRESELPDAARHAHPLADHAKRRMHVRSRPQLGDGIGRAKLARSCSAAHGDTLAAHPPQPHVDASAAPSFAARSAG